MPDARQRNRSSRFASPSRRSAGRSRQPLGGTGTFATGNGTLCAEDASASSDALRLEVHARTRPGDSRQVPLPARSPATASSSGLAHRGGRGVWARRPHVLWPTATATGTATATAHSDARHRRVGIRRPRQGAQGEGSCIRARVGLAESRDARREGHHAQTIAGQTLLTCSRLSAFWCVVREGGRHTPDASASADVSTVATLRA